jgi:hypothetical protein
MKLMNCLALDVEISNFAIDLKHNILAVSAGRVVYVFKNSSFELKQKVIL